MSEIDLVGTPKKRAGRSTRTWRSLGVLFAVIGVVACNALVGNDPPSLREPVAATNEAGPVAEAGPLGPSCTSAEKLCFGTCVPKFNTGFSCASESSCDPCPAAAHATPICNGAVCGSECKKGYDNCDVSSPDCETDLASAKTCGGCNVICEKFCSPDGAGSFRCTDSCDTGLSACGDQCVDLQSTPTSCGTCEKKCPEPLHSTATCASAQCGFTCDPGYHACNGQCVSDTDVNACGASCTQCDTSSPRTTTACRNGACETTCKPGWGECDGSKETVCETNLGNDNLNCGQCAFQCGGGIIRRSAPATPIKPLAPPGPTIINPTCCLGGSCVDCNSF